MTETTEMSETTKTVSKLNEKVKKPQALISVTLLV